METCKKIWMDGKLVDWNDAKIHILTHSLHYWAWVFEGIRVYSTTKWPAIFRLNDHIERFFYSSSAIQMEMPFTQNEIVNAVIDTVKTNELQSWYIRPLAYYWYWKMGLNPTWAPVNVAIACWPWWNYLPEIVNIKITPYIRIHPKSTICDAKITGHYVNSILSVLQLRWTNYDEALLLDFEWNIAEWPWENFYIVKKGKIITPPLWKILKGITRRTAFEIAAQEGIEVIEANIKPEEAFEADEAFFTWTAAKVTSIRSIDDKIIWSWEMWPVTRKIRETYFSIVEGRNPKYERFLTYVQ